MKWQYRTILFEFQKDGLLGDRYIDDEDVEAVLNEQGADGWELVNVSLIQEGLLAFFKRPSAPEGVIGRRTAAGNLTAAHEAFATARSTVTNPAEQFQEQQIQRLESGPRKTEPALNDDILGNIKIS